MPTSIDWPGDLPDGVVMPLNQRDAYSLAPQSALLETDFGLIPRRRQIYAATTGEPEVVTVAWEFDGDEETAFRSFFENDVGQGSKWFNLPLLLSSGVVETREVSFTRDPPVYQPNGTLSTRVTATLITRAGLAPAE